MRNGRDWRVDALRGYFLAVMMLGHLPSHPLQRFSHYTFGFFSAPDGFVFLSGLMCGCVYFRVAEKYGFALLERRITRRLGLLYSAHILLLAFCLLQPSLLALPGARLAYAQAHPLRAWVAGALLFYQPRFFDILPMYCVFLLFVPLTLKQMKLGHSRIVLAVSAFLWTVAQFGVADRNTAIPWIDVGAFNLLAWQAYFVTGLYIGYRKVRHSDCVVPRSRWLLAFCCAVVVCLFVLRHEYLLLPASFRWVKLQLIPSHNPLRFLNFACAAYVLSWVPQAFDSKIENWRISRFFSLLGRHSLVVFSWSVFVSMWVFAWQARWDAAPGLARVAMALSAVLLLAMPAVINEQYRHWRKTKVDYLPAPVTVPHVFS